MCWQGGKGCRWPTAPPTQADAHFSLGGLVALIVLGHWKGLRGCEVMEGFISQSLPDPGPPQYFCLGEQLLSSACPADGQCLGLLGQPVTVSAVPGAGWDVHASFGCRALPSARSLPLTWTPSAWLP